MSDEEITLYCICRSPDIDRFMIMCDQCEEWYHGDCINMTERESRRIKYFYCKWCRRKNPSLQIQYRKSKKSKNRSEDGKKAKKLKKKEAKRKRREDGQKEQVKSEKIKKVIENDDDQKSDITKSNSLSTSLPVNVKKESPQENVSISNKEQAALLSADECGECENCLRIVNCKRCQNCLNPTRDMKCLKRQCLTMKTNLSTSHFEVKKEPLPKKSIKTEYEEEPSRWKNFDISHSMFSQKKFSKPDTKLEIHGRQCYGPGCTLAARSKSKYCSDECGKRLAAKRLLHIMPSRVNDWHHTPTVANEMGREELERIRAAMVQARSELQALEEKFRRLESIITQSKTFEICEKLSDAEETDESDQTIFCVVCGHPVSLRGAIKHMDKCYIKIESQISFGSVYPTRIEGSERLFCDVYNRQQQTYCKRLQVICPEHAKEPKITANEVCGCPLKEDIYTGDEPKLANEFCSRAKRKCNKHFKWESMYRASVDLQRIRQWLKIDEIFEEERRIRNSMVSRAGVVPLLLHQTTAHDPACLDMRTKPSNVKRPAYRLVI
ncbi:CXXC-type zinc finger protein 1-like [Styela clava]